MAAKRLPRLAGGLACVLACMFASLAALAQEVTDPTRPPPLVDMSGGGEAPGSGLQSVFISDTRKAAIIGGQLVELGQKYGDKTLVRVAESEVTLAKGRETQVLHLFPGIEKKLVTTAPDAGAPGKAHKTRKSRERK